MMENREINEEFYNLMFRQTAENSFFNKSKDQSTLTPLNQTVQNGFRNEKFKRVRNTQSLDMKVDIGQIKEKVKTYLKDQKMTPNQLLSKIKLDSLSKD